MSRPTMICQVCGSEADPEVVTELARYNPDDLWTYHRVEQKGGYVVILACVGCSRAALTDILESYKRRIRLGLIPGFH